MKKYLLTLIFLTTVINSRAQSYLGYFNDNYSGVTGVLYNPASIADSPYKAHINLISFSVSGANDYFGVKATDLFKSSYNINDDAKTFPSRNNNFALNTDIMGPSFMVNLAPKHTIAISSRLRGMANIKDANGNALNNFYKGLDTTNFSELSGDFNASMQSWAELGLSYATVLLDKEKHFIKGGLTLKYLQGIANGYAYGKNVSANYTYNSGNPGNSQLVTTGELTYGGTKETNNAIFSNDPKVDYANRGSGFGGDIGFVYEYRPNYNDSDASKYKLRVGLSVTDIGSIKYKDTERLSYNTNGSISKSQYDASTSLQGVLANAGYASIPVSDDASANLPTAAHANIDLNIFKKFFVGLNGDLSLTDKADVNTISIANTVNLTPRYESKWFSFYVPVTWMEYREAQVGAGFRVGPLFLGSGSVISNLVSDESKGFDIHGGLQIPIFGGKKVDTDGDGLYDGSDKCPNEAGPVENKGCPYPDRDKDGTPDKDDKCPDVYGPTANKGCPYPDRDKDGTIDKDDKCPDEFGPKNNDGCPEKDTDKDGILDKDDKCPEVKGTRNNDGCPEKERAQLVPKEEPKQDVVKQLNDFAKIILFDTSKSSIKQESYKIIDQIAEIMKEYPQYSFRLLGHTDSQGNPAKNLKLSKDRAAMVRKFIIDRGIAESRLSSNGFGSKKPVATNKTAAGRAKNRRVEVVLIK
jgi:outer membrane protein OmpA-like peptidoglycan-associated protein